MTQLLGAGVRTQHTAGSKAKRGGKGGRGSKRSRTVSTALHVLGVPSYR